MTEIADYAAQYNITILIEVLNRFEQFLLNDAEEGLNYVKAVSDIFTIPAAPTSKISKPKSATFLTYFR
jgi:hypothetical protein